MKFGDFEIFIVSDGILGLDGGAMFGVVPKPLWEKLIPADDKNRITLGMNCLLIKTPEKNILVDTGAGDKEKDKFQNIYKINRNGGLFSSLKEIDLKPGDIDIVINSHLHFDHAGGNTIQTGGNNYKPAFPEATYFIQKGEWQEGISPNERNQASYFNYNMKPLEKAGQLELIEGEVEITEGVRTLVTPGHTGHHQCIVVESNGQTACFMADLVPTSAHLKLPYIMSYDLFPMKTLQTRKQLYPRIIEENWLMIFEHGTDIIAGYMKNTPENPELESGLENRDRDLITPVAY